MTDYFLRLLIALPAMGALAWASLWAWKRAQLGLPMRAVVDRPARIVDILTLGTSGRLAVVEFGKRTLLVAVSRHGIGLVASHDETRSDA